MGIINLTFHRVTGETFEEERITDQYIDYYTDCRTVVDPDTILDRMYEDLAWKVDVECIEYDRHTDCETIVDDFTLTIADYTCSNCGKTWEPCHVVYEKIYDPTMPQANIRKREQYCVTCNRRRLNV